MREGLDEKLDLSVARVCGHFQIFPIDGFLPTRGGTAELSCGVRRHILSCITIKRVPRVIAAHGMEAALHMNNASGLTFN